MSHRFYVRHLILCYSCTRYWSFRTTTVMTSSLSQLQKTSRKRLAQWRNHIKNVFLAFFQYNLETWSTANNERSVRHILKLLMRRLKEFIIGNVLETHSDFTFSSSLDLQAKRLILQYVDAEYFLRCAESLALPETTIRLQQSASQRTRTPPPTLTLKHSRLGSLSLVYLWQRVFFC